MYKFISRTFSLHKKIDKKNYIYIYIFIKSIIILKKFNLSIIDYHYTFAFKFVYFFLLKSIQLNLKQIPIYEKYFLLIYLYFI